MRVLITGATGYVGAWTAKAAHDDGHQLRLLVRDTAKLRSMASALDFDGADAVAGDMTDADSVARSLDGCDAVIHAAAVVGIRDEYPGQMTRANTAGARNVVGQAVDRGIDPVVYVSSATVFWYRSCPLLHVDLPICGGGDDYAASKVAVEHYVRELQGRGAPVAVTYPCAVMGPPAGDHCGESGDAVALLADVGVLGRGAGFTVADVRDVACAHTRLLEAGRGPRRYVVAGHHIGGRDLARELSRITGRRVRHIPVPDALFVGAGKISDRLGRRRPAALATLSEAGIRYLTDMPPADNAPAERDLGVTFRPTADTLGALLAGRAT